MTSLGVLHHLIYPLKAFNEIYRVLKPNGEAWIYDLITDAPNKRCETRTKGNAYFFIPFSNILPLLGAKV